ncbi:MAG TPA: hypothetical protein VF838_07835 [Trebonia sp.]
MALALCPAWLHATVTGHEPAAVFVPTFHVQVTDPLAPAVAGPSPAALDGPDAYTTTIVQVALAAVLTTAVSNWPGLTAGRLTNVTVTAAWGAVGRGVAVGVGCGVGLGVGLAVGGAEGWMLGDGLAVVAAVGGADSAKA